MLEKGLQFIKEVVVKPENLAVAMGSGDLPVLATPAMVAFMENQLCLLLKINCRKAIQR